jgi:hypothetical protein
MVLCPSLTPTKSRFKIVANASLRERPFNLKGGLCLFSKKNVLIPNVAEKNILILVEGKKNNLIQSYRTTFRLLRTKITVDLLFPCKQII